MKTDLHTVYIGLGSNMENPVCQISTAFLELSELPVTELDVHSSLYQSAPMGPQDQPDYMNAVARVKTSLNASDLLDHLQAIEQAHKRVRNRHWGERTLDLDILLFDDEQISNKRLTIPHPGLTERNFVLYPLAEIDPAIEIPGKGSLDYWIKQTCEAGLQRLDVDVASMKDDCE